MGLLDTIKDQVARENGRPNWSEMMYWDSSLAGFNKPHLIDEVARRYAKAVAEDALKRASENAKMLFHDGTYKTNSTIKYFQSGADNLRVDKQSILSTLINTDL